MYKKLSTRTFLSVLGSISLLLLLSFPVAAETTILARQYVTKTVHISGGHYLSPYVISAPNTEYILDGDIIADSTAISIRASKVVLNLNGHSITYNQAAAGEGVRVDAWNLTDIAVTNGSVVQGAAQSEGGLYGVGNNPISTSPYTVARMQIADVSVRYGGRDVAGFVVKGSNPLVENNVVEDTYKFGTLKDRHSGVSAVYLNGVNAVVRNNQIINCRHRGIEVKNYAEVYGNTISIRSIATNAVGISGWSVHGVKVHHNNITGRGEHPIGIGFSGDDGEGTFDIEVYNNTIDVFTDRLGVEYGGDLGSCTGTSPCGTAHATGLRLHKHGLRGIYVHDNNVTVTSDAKKLGTYSPTGQAVWLNSKGRGIQVGNPADGSAVYEKNTVIAMDKDGTGEVGGIVCDTNYAGSGLVVKGNTVTSNLAPLVLGDGYGWCQGNPLFIQNTFIKSTEYSATPNYPANFHTISSGLGGYYEGTGTLISNIYQNGASEGDLNMHFGNLTNGSSNKNKSIIFGRLMEGTVRDSSQNPLPNIIVRTYNSSHVLETETTTDADGKARIIVFDYELNNAGGKTGSAIPEMVIFKPHTLEFIRQDTGQALFSTQPDSSANAWDDMRNSGTHTLANAGHSVSIQAVAATYIPLQLNMTPPSLRIRAITRN